MDAGLSHAVRETFVRLWERGLIYRGEYMVNWCPQCQTAISDVETTHEAVEGHLWHIRYAVAETGESMEVATTRPETMLGDTALAVHPDDARYLHLHGKKAIVPLMNREIPIITDTMVDPKFGTGVVKITPAHDPNDFEAGKRHKLESIKVIGEDARMTAAAGRYSGLDRFEARKRIVAALEESGELVKTELYTVNISKCDRSKTIIEPLVSTQWFVRMKPLAEKALAAVRNGDIRFVPDDRQVVFFQWMENIRDWCVSRQLWWGHRIPAWHCRQCSEVTVARQTPAVCHGCGSTEVEQDTDVLDTWFSSGLWPFSTLGWPEETDDLKTYYPNTLLITGFDILFFWASRMMMLGIELTGQVPFREVHLHGLVRTADKQKMSKTKGNVIDPLEIMARYGTDACRVALLISASAGADIALKEDRMEASRAFANKLWNASRLLFMNMDRSQIKEWASGEPVAEHFEDRWILARLNFTINQVNEALAVHRYHEAAQEIWRFAWNEFCDWYLEVKKLRFRENSGVDSHWSITLAVYETMLRLLHPFMPFITEELWQRLVERLDMRPHSPSISLQHFPKPISVDTSDGAFIALQQIVKDAREQRADKKVEPKTVAKATLTLRENLFLTEELAILSELAKLKLEVKQDAQLAPWYDLRIHVESAARNAMADAEVLVRMKKERDALSKVIASSESQLADEVFLSRAPEKVVTGLRNKLLDYKLQRQKLHLFLEGHR